MDNKKAKKATKHQRERIDHMLKSGLIDRDEAQAIIKKPRVTNLLGVVHFRRRVTYEETVPWPTDREAGFCADVFGEHASCIGDGLFDGRRWEPHASCARISLSPGMRDFWIAEVPKRFLGKPIAACWDELAAHFRALGYRFAIMMEALEFCGDEPWFLGKNLVLALGSFTHGDSYRGKYVAAIDAAFHRDESRTFPKHSYYLHEPSEEEALLNDAGSWDDEEGLHLLLVRIAA